MAAMRARSGIGTDFARGGGDNRGLRNGPVHHTRVTETAMQPQGPTTRLGKVSWGLAAWLLGLPLPIILIALLWGGCTKW